MERKKDLNKRVIQVLALLYGVGSVGLIWPLSRPMFQLLTPFHLIISLSALLWFHNKWSPGFIMYASFIFLVGYGVEVAGVKTGIIFGAYQYGGTLGFKLFEVPLVMGINWLLLIYICASILNRLSISMILKVSVAALCMMFLDLFIEPAAIALDFWDWESVKVPLQNYLSWFVISWFLILGMYLGNWVEDNPLALPIYLMQLLFFLIINVFL